MLFNSYGFLLVFLPLALLLHWAVVRSAPRARVALLVVLSFVFYGYWDWRFIPLLALSIVCNWLLVEVFIEMRRGYLITLAIAVNLLVLGFFKYALFLLELTGASLPTPAVFGLGGALPLGISFFTFHHIMYLVDLRKGLAPRYGLAKYALYIAFFPQVLAGPLVRWSQVMHQFDENPYLRSDAAERFAKGLLLLVLGLAKKLLGDALAEPANAVFALAPRVSALSFADAWQGVLAFTFQIYFDFSGYTDMAIGIALMLGVVLPQNFNAPYRATSLQDFWRRWHMTLSTFLRDYLYIPLGGSRHGLQVQLLALVITMVLGGLWHGAGLTFLAWGALHGIGLAVVVLWTRTGLALPALLGAVLTFSFVVVTWVLFRATSFAAAGILYDSMFMPASFAHVHVAASSWLLIAAAAAIAMVGPTSWDLARGIRPTLANAGSVAALLALSLTMLSNEHNYKFIYFQF